ncbi:MAG: hypothetical protein ACTHU0_29640 [Kofleriaceae bacterium]
MALRSNTSPLELWAGVECTLNRVGDRFFDQVVRSGHHRRDDDIDRIASLGIRTVRYPVLWERTAPGALADADWSWADARLVRLRGFGIAPVVGLVHHGSGPAHTSLIDPRFPAALAGFARAVAERYPWVAAYTPVDEPLKTARFSGLYGHWYPHGRDDRTFARALLHQCRATVLAMREVRAVNPAAQLVVTEDLGFTWSTPALRDQPDYANERRWLSLDLIAGRVDRDHPMRPWLRAIGIADGELEWFVEHPCLPQVIGCNSYRECGLGGIDQLLRDAWNRFGLPLAVTAAHLGTTREEQLRWLVYLHDAAASLRGSGVPVHAVTAWPLFGAFDWHNLLTRDDGVYVPGVFDVRGPAPRPTALVAALRALAGGRRPEHPVLAGHGWWRRFHDGKAA